MCYSAVSVCVSWCLLVPVVGSLYICEGPDDLAAEWPTEQELRNFNETTEGDVFLRGTKEWEEAGKMRANILFNSMFGAVFYPETTVDVKKAILFARQHNIRPTISSSTHSFVGRSAGEDTFHINMAKMKLLEIKTNETESPTGKSVRTGTGNSWIDIYKEVDKYDLVAVGGSAHTVTPGGWTLGGGHSPITRKLGLGVDQVLEFTMVTADGSIATVTANDGTVVRPDGTTEPLSLSDNSDLWWSVLGGGGGTYGVVTQFNLKLYDAPPDGFISFRIGFIIFKNGPCAGVATEGKYQGVIIIYLYHWGGDLQQAKEDMKTLTDFRPECQSIGVHWEEYETFLEYSWTIDSELSPMIYILSTFVQVDDLEDDSGLASFLTSLEEVPVESMGCICILNGGASANYLDESTCVYPEFRTAKCTLTCGGTWRDSRNNSVMAEAVQGFAGKLQQHGTSVYFNEPDYNLENWKEEFWGSMDRYNRLLRVKQQWDPDNLFWCHHCVGSDLVTHESEEPCFDPFGLKKFVTSSAGHFPPTLLLLPFLVLMLYNTSS